MPPKRSKKGSKKEKKVPGTPPFKIDHAYFKCAYRQRIKTLKPTWDLSQLNGTLAWLWKFASDDVKNECKRLVKDGSKDLPETDDRLIPADAKKADSPGPHEGSPSSSHPSREASPIRPDESGAELPELPVDEDEPTRKRKRRAMNTTNLPFMPDFQDMDAEIPTVGGDGERLTKAQQNQWLLSGLHFPDREEEGFRWRGAHFLGQGATGRVGLWVKTNATNTIIESLAVRDVVVHPEAWISPLYWRDRLPREIAIQSRLREVNAHDHNVHRLDGHRISLRNHSYRVFNEFCSFGDLREIVSYYKDHWHQHYAKYRFKKIRLRDEDDRIRAWSAYREYKRTNVMDKLDYDGSHNPDIVRWQQNMPQYYQQMDGSPNIMSWGDDEIALSVNPDTIPVIPESFLWHVFAMLSEAFLVLGEGRVPPAAPAGDEADGIQENEEPWQEIRHTDVHIGNIFVRHADGEPEEDSLAPAVVDVDPIPKDKRDYRYACFAEEHVPRPVLADFDRAFFDLARPEDVFKDNPFTYYIADGVVDCRYPPDLFGVNGGNTMGGQRQPHPPITAKSDVWGLVSI
ncbi:hypothetical protein NX059_001273 [Plenodomus lindquistii]|nr:hypothetical protein NX059_001273 [Plenodomus lindquistii]